MGNPRKPMAIREIQGTDQQNKHRQNHDAPEPSRGIGEPPEYLSESQRAIWDEVVSNMYKGVLGEADRVSFEVMVRLIDEMRIDFTEFTAAKLSQLRGLLSCFGMTPSDRLKISIPKEKNKSAFSDL